MLLYSQGEHPKKKEGDTMKTMTITEYSKMMSDLWETFKSEKLTDEEAMKRIGDKLEEMVAEGWRIVEG